MSFCVESDIQSIVHLDAYGWILNVIETFVLQERTKKQTVCSTQFIIQI
jgi:hypothetical protein